MAINENMTVSLDREFADYPEQSQRPQLVLVVLDGPNLHGRYEITKSEVTLGRDEVCEIALGDTACSRCHAKITTLMPPGADLERDAPEAVLTDLGSTNGTLVNGARVDSVKLKNGDRIMLGKTLLGFYVWDEKTIQAEDLLMRQATMDGVTSLYNRAFFNDVIHREYGRTRRYGRTFSVIVMNIDHFKTFNESYGERACDLVLQEVARVVVEASRKNDIACRHGEEQIVILLPETPVSGALVQANRLCDAVRGAPVRIGSGDISVTASLGVVELQPWMREAEDLLEAADKALNQAKQQGGNQVAWDTGYSEDNAQTLTLHDVNPQKPG